MYHPYLYPSPFKGKDAAAIVDRLLISSVFTTQIPFSKENTKGTKVKNLVIAARARLDGFVDFI